MLGERSDGAPAPSLESVQEVRLLALLHDLVRKEGRSGAAAILGVHRKTVAAAVNTGRLSRRMQDALGMLLMERKAAGALVGRVGESRRPWEQHLETALRRQREELLAVIGTEGQRLRDEATRWAQTVEQRLVALEAHRREGGGAAMAPCAAKASLPGVPPVVTVKPASGEAAVYGAAAPLIAEWRRARDARAGAADPLTAATAEEQLRELELALIETHRLTLPPATAPWEELTRRDEPHWRRRTLARVRSERRRAVWRRRLRWVLTFGWW